MRNLKLTKGRKQCRTLFSNARDILLSGRNQRKYIQLLEDNNRLNNRMQKIMDQDLRHRWIHRVLVLGRENNFEVYKTLRKHT